MLVSIPLTDDERAAIDDGQTTLGQLLGWPADVPAIGTGWPGARL